MRRARAGETENQNLATKKREAVKDESPKLLPGSVERRYVRCGKPSCKCARGKLHGPYFYHVTTDNTLRSRRYVRRSDVATVRAACNAHRELQTELRQGRANYKALLSRVRELSG